MFNTHNPSPISVIASPVKGCQATRVDRTCTRATHCERDSQGSGDTQQFGENVDLGTNGGRAHTNIDLESSWQ